MPRKKKLEPSGEKPEPPAAPPTHETAPPIKLNTKQKNVLEDIFFDPIKSSIKWDDIINLFKALGGEVSTGNGSRVRIFLNGNVGLFHRPHPEPTTDKGALKSVRSFLTQSGVHHETGI
jgi:HicA toxin of bacterial toxin-antitoxin,